MQIKAKELSNWSKAGVIFILLLFNAIRLISTGKIASYDEQKSLILACGFIVLILIPIDLSLLAKNIFQKAGVIEKGSAE